MTEQLFEVDYSVGYSWPREQGCDCQQYNSLLWWYGFLTMWQGVGFADHSKRMYDLDW